MNILSRTRAVLLAALIAPVAAHAQFSGSSLGLQYYFDTFGTVVEDRAPVVVNSGIEFAGVQDAADIDVRDNSVYITFLIDGSNWTDAAFNGFRLYDPGGMAPAFTSVTVDPSSTFLGVDPSRISFDGDDIYVNWQGLPVASDEFLQLDLNGGPPLTPTPEPASLVLFATGATAVVGAARRRRTR